MGPIVGVVAGYGGMAMLARAWNECEIGINASANFWSLIPVFFAAWGAAALIWAISFGAFGGKSLLLATAMGILGTLCMYWILMAGWRAPDGYPVSVSACAPDNIPPWWPQWLPL
ncbi:hypothetical protein [Actinacidiphila glaucinigra]|uniref:hypothetical protein n=1 Tax=Actinacidiphila glaucinigra TaxID=235986 RepID=UPI0029BF6179|nr:hypothetical protein [Streptomyces sp. PA03-3a]